MRIPGLFSFGTNESRCIKKSKKILKKLESRFPLQTFVAYPNIYESATDYRIGTVVILRALPSELQYLQFVSAQNFS